MPPTASRNGTAKTVLFGAPSMPLQRQPRLCPLTRCSTDRQQKPYEQRRAETARRCFCFKGSPIYTPCAAPPPLRLRRGLHVIPAAAASAQRRPVNSKEKSRGNFSAPLRRAVNAVSAAAKACSGGVPPIGDKNRRAAPGRPDTDLLPYQSRPCPHICAAPQKQLISQASAAAARRNDFHTVSAASSGHRHCRQPVNDGAIKGRINTAAAPARFWCHSRVGQVVSSTSPRRKHK